MRYCCKGSSSARSNPHVPASPPLASLYCFSVHAALYLFSAAPSWLHMHNYHMSNALYTSLPFSTPPLPPFHLFNPCACSRHCAMAASHSRAMRSRYDSTWPRTSTLGTRRASSGWITRLMPGEVSSLPPWGVLVWFVIDRGCESTAGPRFRQGTHQSPVSQHFIQHLRSRHQARCISMAARE